MSSTTLRYMSSHDINMQNATSYSITLSRCNTIKSRQIESMSDLFFFEEN